MKASLTVLLNLIICCCNAQNIGIGTTTPIHKLDVYGNIGLFGRQALTDANDGYLRINQAGNYVNGLYTPYAFRTDGGFVSGSAASLGSGTIVATSYMKSPTYYDISNNAYYMAPANTSNLNILRFNVVDCMNGMCPTNNLMRYTPNFHLNAGTNNAVIINWDNGSTPASNVQQFRVGNGQGADAFYVTSSGQVFANGQVGIGISNPNARLHVMEPGNGSTAIYAENNITGTSDGQGVHGKAVNNPGYGYGGIFEGGYMGINAFSSAGSYAGSAFGVYGSVAGSAGTRFGVEGLANTLSGTVTGYGVYGSATGAATNYGVYCNGNGAYTGTWSSVSDQKLKSNIQDYSGALNKVLQLSPKTYSFKTQDYPYMNLPEGEQIGLIAQDVQRVFPQLVQNNNHPVDTHLAKQVQSAGTTFKSMNYIGLTPILVEAIKEQQQIIEEQKHIISGMKSDMEAMHRELDLIKQKLQ